MKWYIHIKSSVKNHSFKFHIKTSYSFIHSCAVCFPWKIHGGKHHLEWCESASCIIKSEPQYCDLIPDKDGWQPSSLMWVTLRIIYFFSSLALFPSSERMLHHLSPSGLGRTTEGVGLGLGNIFFKAFFLSPHVLGVGAWRGRRYKRRGSFRRTVACSFNFNKMHMA